MEVCRRHKFLLPEGREGLRGNALISPPSPAVTGKDVVDGSICINCKNAIIKNMH